MVHGPDNGHLPSGQAGEKAPPVLTADATPSPLRALGACASDAELRLRHNLASNCPVYD